MAFVCLYSRWELVSDDRTGDLRAGRADNHAGLTIGNTVKGDPVKVGLNFCARYRASVLISFSLYPGYHSNSLREWD